MLHHPAVRQLHGHRLHIAVAADFEADFAARRDLPEQPAQLFGALDVLPVQLEHYVVNPQSDMPRRRVVIDQRNDRAAQFLELERLRLFLVNVGQIHTQVALRAAAQQQRIGLLYNLQDPRALRRSRRHAGPRCNQQ